MAHLNSTLKTNFRARRVQVRINYMLHHLEKLSRELWNESTSAADLGTGDLDIGQVRETLKLAGPDSVGLGHR